MPTNLPVPQAVPGTAPANTQPGTAGSGWFSEITSVLTSRGPTGPRGGRGADSIAEAMAKSAARAVASQAGRQIVRGVLGSIFGGGSSRR